MRLVNRRTRSAQRPRTWMASIHSAISSTSAACSTKRFVGVMMVKQKGCEGARDERDGDARTLRTRTCQRRVCLTFAYFSSMMTSVPSTMRITPRAFEEPSREK